MTWNYLSLSLIPAWGKTLLKGLFLKSLLAQTTLTVEQSTAWGKTLLKGLFIMSLLAQTTLTVEQSTAWGKTLLKGLFLMNLLAQTTLTVEQSTAWGKTLLKGLLPRYGAFDLGLAVSVPLLIVTGIFVLLWFQSRLTYSCKEIVYNIFIHRWSGDYYFCTWIISLAVL